MTEHWGRKTRRVLATALGTLLLGGCVSLPDGIEPVSGFELERYLGTWYEIARLDHSFERGLSRVTAEYSMRDDGGVKVLNRGFKEASGEWKEAVGRAYFVESSDIGQLKVSFFGPFYGGYNIISLDKQDYQWALVCGPNRDYLWVLARSPRLDAAIFDALIDKAGALGFDTGALIRVAHD